MTEISKKNRDIAMRAIVDFYQNKKPYDGSFISPDYLYHHGLPAEIDAMQTARVLEGLGLIELKKHPTLDTYAISLRPKGRCYFEAERDEHREKRKDRLHDWALALFSAIAGALLSEPVWAIIRYVLSLARISG